MPKTQGRIDFDGAVVRVQVSISAARERRLHSAGQLVPQPFVTTALIDTGASQSIIHPMMAPYLGLVAEDFTRVNTAAGGSARAPVYAVRVALDEPSGPWPRIAVEVAAVEPATSSVLVIIGRDLLAAGLLLYDGPGQVFSVEF